LPVRGNDSMPELIRHFLQSGINENVIIYIKIEQSAQFFHYSISTTLYLDIS